MRLAAGCATVILVLLCACGGTSGAPAADDGGRDLPGTDAPAATDGTIDGIDARADDGGSRDDGPAADDGPGPGDLAPSDFAPPDPDPTDLAPGDAPPSDPGPAATLVFRTPGATCVNPCTFTVDATGPVATVTYSAEDQWVLGSSAAAAAAFPVTYTFNVVGDRWVRAHACDASGAEIAAADHAFRVLAPPAANRLGAWLWYVEETGLTHGELADRLADLGVGRVFVKVADGRTTWAEADDAGIPATYQAAGLEAFAWSYNYPGNEAAQAQALTKAAAAGYDGYVLDLEVEFDGSTTGLRALLSAFFDARSAARSAGTVPAAWPLFATTWGNPADHDMHVEIIDEYVDAHLPQTYLEKWGSSYVANAAATVRDGTCEYRGLGATKPVHHIVSDEDGVTPTSAFDAFFQASGPESSLWRIPGGGVPESFWDDWAAIDWHRTAFDPEPACP